MPRISVLPSALSGVFVLLLTFSPVTPAHCQQWEKRDLQAFIPGTPHEETGSDVTATWKCTVQYGGGGTPYVKADANITVKQTLPGDGVRKGSSMSAKVKQKYIWTDISVNIPTVLDVSILGSCSGSKSPGGRGNPIGTGTGTISQIPILLVDEETPTVIATSQGASSSAPNPFRISNPFSLQIVTSCVQLDAAAGGGGVYKGTVMATASSGASFGEPR